MTEKENKLSTYIKKGQEESSHKLSNFRKKEIPSESHSFLGDIGRDALIGLSNLGHRTLNSPSDFAHLMEKRGEEFGEATNQTIEKLYKEGLLKRPEGIAKDIPRQEEFDYASALGQNYKPGLLDLGIQKGIEYAPDLMSLWGAYRELPIALTRRGASRELRQAQQLARERNVGNIDIPPQLIEDVTQFLPNTHAYRRLLEQAQLGDYNSLFALQSDLARASRGYARSPSFAERRLGREAGRSRNDLLALMRHGLGRQGHLDIADLLRTGQRRYRNFSRIRPIRNVAALGIASQTPYAKKLFHSILNMF